MEVSIDDLSINLPGRNEALFRIPRWKVATGEKVLVRGPSGRGKTTFLHALAGLLLPTTGQIRLGDQTLGEISERQRTRFRQDNIGLVFQKLNLFGHLTALENVLLAGPKVSESSALSQLDRLGLATKASLRSSRLSGGEQQRVAVARVLAGRPNLILADEPTASLDPENADRVIQALLAGPISQTLIVVSHDARLVGHFGNRAVDFGELSR